MSSAAPQVMAPPATQLPVADGAYRTAPRPIGLLARTFPSTAFYLRFFSIVWGASRLAKRSKYDGRAWSHSSYEVLDALESVGVRVEVTGIDRLEALDSPCLVVGNHMSTLETAILPCIIQPIRHVTFVVKQALVEMPVFKHVMRSRDPIVLAQTNPREDLKTMLTEGAARIEQGVSVVVFPQGRRTPVFDAAEFNTIGVKLAHRTGVPIVPLALMTDAWALGRPFPDIGRIDPARPVRFAFGEPLCVTGRGTEENRAIIDFIQSKLREWKSQDA